MLEIRESPSKIFKMETLNTIILVCLSLALLNNQIETQSLQDKVNVLSNSFSNDYECSKLKGSDNLLCVKLTNKGFNED